jgi:hypothetical protein
MEVKNRRRTGIVVPTAKRIGTPKNKKNQLIKNEAIDTNSNTQRRFAPGGGRFDRNQWPN